jgi:hypothetical protein
MCGIWIRLPNTVSVRNVATDLAGVLKQIARNEDEVSGSIDYFMIRYLSPDTSIIREVKLERLRWAGHVARKW